MIIWNLISTVSMNMDRQNHSLFGNYMPTYAPSDPALNIPGKFR